MSGADQSQDAFLDAVGEFGAPLLQLLAAMDIVARQLHPPRILELRSSLVPLVTGLEAARVRFASQARPEGLEGLAGVLLDAGDEAVQAGRLFIDEGEPGEAIGRILGAMEAHTRAQAVLFSLADVLPPVHRFFLEPAMGDSQPLPGPAPQEGRRVGLVNAANGSGERGGFSLFVPPNYAPDRPWPLIVALHGGSGHGAGFLWTWLREARSRGFLLLAPTSIRSTWSLGPDDVDRANLRRQVEWISERWNVDPGRLLLTGLSDGATYTLLEGLSEGSPFTALAPVSGVFHPVHFLNGNLDRVTGRRIHLVHGALDWMFPVDAAREAADVLRGAGADLVFHEIADLSHAYPREHNDAILSWFDPSLALPAREGAE